MVWVYKNLGKAYIGKFLGVCMDTDDLEAAINSAKSEAAPAAEAEVKSEAVKMSEEEEKGFHKGALNTLVAERNELVKMVGNVEAIAQAHVKRLEELGVKMSK